MTTRPLASAPDRTGWIKHTVSVTWVGPATSNWRIITSAWRSLFGVLVGTGPDVEWKIRHNGKIVESSRKKS